jgi:dihydroorotase
MLYVKGGAKQNLVLRGARALDPVEGVDAQIDVKVDDGVIAELGSNLSPNGHRVIDGAGLVLAPAFVDPHVHLRTPGREDEETIASGTQAAAAGGYCTILAMPNTEPEVQVGFLAAISKGQEGAELTEMGELADEGAVGFTDDGRPVVATSLMWRALQYSSITQRPLAVHCEDPTLSRGGHMREGIVSAELGIGGWPSIAESVMVERDLALASYESRTLHLMHLSARASVEAVRRAHAERVRATAEVTPHHLVLTDELRSARSAGVKASGEVTPHHLCLTDEAVRSLDPNVKMNPPLGAEDDRKALVEALRDGTISCVATDHAPHARHEKEVPFEAAPFGVTGLETAFAALYTHLVEPGLISLETLLERMSAGPARAYGFDAPRIAVGAPANLVLLDTQAGWQVSEDGFKSRSKNSWLIGEKLRGRVRATVAAGRLVHES